MRTVTVLVNNPLGNPDTFDHMHKYRFVLFSIADILNGLSVLYCFHSMASLARKQRLSLSQQQTMSTGDNNHMRDSLNEILLNRMRQKNNRGSPMKKGSGRLGGGKRVLSSEKQLPPYMQRRMMH
jgi:hypothetical protein